MLDADTAALGRVAESQNVELVAPADSGPIGVPGQVWRTSLDERGPARLDLFDEDALGPSQVDRSGMKQDVDVVPVREMRFSGMENCSCMLVDSLMRRLLGGELNRAVRERDSEVKDGFVHGSLSCSCQVDCSMLVRAEPVMPESAQALSCKYKGSSDQLKSVPTKVNASRAASDALE